MATNLKENEISKTVEINNGEHFNESYVSNDDTLGLIERRSILNESTNNNRGDFSQNIPSSITSDD